MPIDLNVALSASVIEETLSWTTTDVLLYHLSLGAGSLPNEPELHLTYEKDLSVLPTFALVAGTGPSSGTHKPPQMVMPGIDIDLRKVLHAGQYVTVHRPLPSSGQAVSRRRVSAVVDKNKAALIELETTATNDDGPLWTHVSQIWARGEGGCGSAGEAFKPRKAAEGELTKPDISEVLSAPTRVNQAALYRLNGDFNPLHIDPDFARNAGLDRPILHGLATLGISALALTRRYGTGLSHIGASFSQPVFPGDGLDFEVSVTGASTFAFEALTTPRNATVLAHGEAQFDFS